MSSKKKFYGHEIMSTVVMLEILQNHLKKKKLRCPEDMKWLKEYLEKKHLKAYRKDVNIMDFRNRIQKNEVQDWCRDEKVHFWCEQSNSESWKMHL